MGTYAAATVEVGDHIYLPETHPFEKSVVTGRTERDDGMLEFGTRVLAIDTRGINPVGLRPEGVEDTLIVAPGDAVKATLQRNLLAREFEVTVIDTHILTIRVLAVDKVSAEDAAYWRLSSGHDTGDARITDDQSGRRYEVSD